MSFIELSLAFLSVSLIDRRECNKQVSTSYSISHSWVDCFRIHSRTLMGEITDCGGLQRSTNFYRPLSFENKTECFHDFTMWLECGNRDFVQNWCWEIEKKIWQLLISLLISRSTLAVVAEDSEMVYCHLFQLNSCYQAMAKNNKVHISTLFCGKLKISAMFSQ